MISDKYRYDFDIYIFDLYISINIKVYNIHINP